MLACTGLIHAGGAAAQWRYEEKIDLFTDNMTYARAVNDAVSDSKEIFHLVLLCENSRKPRAALIPPGGALVPAEVRFRVDGGQTHTSVWRPEDNRPSNLALEIGEADWQVITKDAKEEGRLAVGINVLGLTNISMVFVMSGWNTAIPRVYEVCEAQRPR